MQPRQSSHRPFTFCAWRPGTAATLVTLWTACFSQPAIAALLRVPEDYPTITQAANVAQPGDSIQIAPGTYQNEVFNLTSGVTIFGIPNQNGIHPYLRNSTAYLLSGPDSTVVTQLRFYADPGRYSIVSQFSRTSITFCRFQSSGPFFWASIYFPYGGSVRFSSFLGALESMGIRHEQGTVHVAHCWFGVQSPITVFNEGAPQPAHVVLRNNNFSGYSDFLLNPGSTMEVVNNIFYNAYFGTCHGQIPPSAVKYNDFFNQSSSCFGYGEGNIFLDPMYCDFPYGSWLRPESPCVGSGEGGANMGAFPVCGVTSVPEVPALAPRLLHRAYPIPFESVATIVFELPRDGDVNLDIYNAAGRRVAELLNSNVQAGLHQIRWFSREQPAGTYFYKIVARNEVGSGRIVKLK